LEVSRCDPLNREGTTCASAGEINAYMNQIRIKVNLIQNQINFGKYGEVPTSKFRKVLADERLSPSQTLKSINYLKQNQIES
jgi:hypothetical protein